MRPALLLLLAAFHLAAHAGLPTMEEYERKLSLGIGSQQADYDFQIGGGKKLDFKPNVASLTVFTINYTGIGALSYGLRQAMKDETRIKGSSHYQDWRFNFPYRQANIFLFYSRYKGMYLSNTNAVDSSTPSSAPFIIMPDLFAQNMGANLTWVWNAEKYSLAAVMDFTERQVKAGGSFLIGVAATETIFRSSGAIIPIQAKADYGGDAEMYEGRVRALSWKAGYGYTDVFRKRWFTSLLANVGAGPQEVRISTPGEDYTISRIGLNLVEGYGVIGFNGERAFGGLNVYTAVASYQGKRAQISTQLMTGGLFLGARL